MITICHQKATVPPKVITLYMHSPLALFLFSMFGLKPLAPCLKQMKSRKANVQLLQVRMRKFCDTGLLQQPATDRGSRLLIVLVLVFVFKLIINVLFILFIPIFVIFFAICNFLGSALYLSELVCILIYYVS